MTFIKRARQFGRFVLQTTMDYPPDWMLDEKQDLKPEYYDVLARYFVKYTQVYTREGIVIDYISPFNEPEDAYTKIPFSKVIEFIGEHLGPQFERAGLATRLQASDSHRRSSGLRNFPDSMKHPATSQ